MSNAERDVTKFLREQCFRERKTDALTGFALRHASPGAKGNDVDFFEVPETLNSDNISGFVDDILERAQSDASGMGPGVHRYVLQARAEGKDLARCAFRMAASDDEFGEGAGDEPPTLRGIVQQQMRHNEALARIMTMGVQAQLNQNARVMENQNAQITKLIEQRQKDAEVIEAARSQEHEREMQLLITSGNEERKGKIFEQFNALLPILMNRVAGAQLLTPTQKNALKGFVDTLGPEQLEKIRSTLDPAQQVALLHMIKALQDEEKQKQLSNGAS